MVQLNRRTLSYFDFHYLKQAKNLKVKLLLVFLHGSLLLLAAIRLQYTNYLRADENDFLKLFTILKHDIFRHNPKPIGDSVVFIDISKDIKLIPDTINNAPVIEGRFKLDSSQIVITDRVKLAWLFHLLNSHPEGYKYILCDLYFELPSADDPILRPEIEKARNCIVSAEFNGNRLAEPVFKLNCGSVDYYSTARNQFNKLMIFDRGFKTLPVKMMEDLSAGKFTQSQGWTFQDGRPAFNTVIPEFFYRKEDLHDASRERPNLLYLYQLFAQPEVFEKYLKSKYIIIGDFSGGDEHVTYQGALPGPIILFDSFLTLRDYSAAITAGWCLFLLLCFFGVSYRIFLFPPQSDHTEPVIRVNLFNDFWVKYVSYLGLFILINFVSFFVFNKLVSILYLVTYLTILEFILQKWLAYQKNRSLSKTLLG